MKSPTCILLLLAAILGPALAPRATAASAAQAGGFNIRNAASVKRVVRQLIAKGAVKADWTGNVATGDPGTVSSAYQAATLTSVNLLRKLAGLSPVAFDPALSAKCAQAALMMSANGQLDHAPPPSWKFYSADGAEAAGNSDLFLGFAGPQALPGYIDDGGAGNEVVGHRRWILWSQSQIMGSGNILQNAGSPAANALWVLPAGAAPAPTTRGGFVAWPYAGSIPNGLVFKRWSFAIPFADFSSARVGVQLGRKNIPTRIVDRTTLGLGDSTIVFQPKLSYTAPDFRSFLYPAHLKVPRAPVIYAVSVKGVKLADGAIRDFKYRVTVFPMP